MAVQAPAILGEDPAFLDVVEQCSRLAAVDRPCLVVGERGTGKELFAARLHYLSPRWGGPLVKVNCATLTESLLESELFGHEVGAFTGAQRRRAGRFERADSGTLFLDEIASASAAVQEKVLRAIEYGEIERVGGSDVIGVDVRVVAAANEDLPALARQGRFRADLLDRLAFEVLTLPPLRARPADILPLARAFAMEATRALGHELFGGFGPAAERQLHAHDWPGNVRELRNVVERAVYRTGGDGAIDAVTLDPFASPWRPGSEEEDVAATADPVHDGTDAGSDRRDFPTRVAAFERRLLDEALRVSRFNQRRAAEGLGLGYHQLRRLLKKHRVAVGR